MRRGARHLTLVSSSLLDYVKITKEYPFYICKSGFQRPRIKPQQGIYVISVNIIMMKFRINQEFHTQGIGIIKTGVELSAKKAKRYQGWQREKLNQSK